MHRALFGSSAPRGSGVLSITDQLLIQTLAMQLMSEAAESCGADPNIVPTTIVIS